MWKHSRQWTMCTISYTYCNMPPFKNIFLELKKKSLTTTNQIIWGVPAAEYVPSYNSSIVYNSTGTDNRYGIHCSMWGNEPATHNSQYLVHSCICWRCHLQQEYVTSYSWHIPYLPNYNNIPFKIPIFRWMPTLNVFRTVFH